MEQIITDIKNVIENKKNVLEKLEMYESINKLIQKIENTNKKTNEDIYKKQIRNNLTSLLSFFNKYQDLNSDTNKQQIENICKNLDFFVNFFEKLGFFDSNIVIVGANGSGKTTLSIKLKQVCDQNCIMIPAQKVFNIQNENSIFGLLITTNAIKNMQGRDKTNKSENEVSFLMQDFGVILRGLISEHYEYTKEYHKKSQQNEEKVKIELTKLDKVFELWSEFFTDKKFELKDANIIVKNQSNIEYSLMGMSDGEKYILYLIGQILLAPEKSFIIIDEPEMFLHKSILNKLWDKLENERKDCLFIYLTHDLDFAVSRYSVKKVWIKSFTYPADWQLEDIPDTEIPESLMLEILGSKKTILFCEGEKENSLDYKIYNILFLNYKIYSVGGCENVKNYTKALNKIKINGFEAKGLIDADFLSDQEKEKLKENNIFTINVAEIENLLLDENFLKKLAIDIRVVQNNVIENIKTKIIEELQKTQEKDNQISKYVLAKIHHYFFKTQILKVKNKKELGENYKDFISNINIDEWYNERENEIDNIKKNDYEKSIRIFNHKGLKKIINDEFSITDFQDRAIRYLEENEEAQEDLKKYFPAELFETKI